MNWTSGQERGASPEIPSQHGGEEFFDEAWDEFFLWNDVPDDVEGSREFETTFDPFFVFAFVPDSATDELPAEWPTE